MNSNIYSNSNLYSNDVEVDYMNLDHQNLRLHEVYTLPVEFCLKKSDHLGKFDFLEVDKCLHSYNLFKKQYFSQNQ
jgi:hypothetical protein